MSPMTRDRTECGPGMRASRRMGWLCEQWNYLSRRRVKHGSRARACNRILRYWEAEAVLHRRVKASMEKSR